MKRMKNYMVSLWMVVTVVLPVQAQNQAQHREYEGEMRVTPLRLEQKGDSLYVEIDFDIRGVNVQSNSSISLIPVLAAPEVDRSLPEVMVKGRSNFLVSKREVALMNKAQRKSYDHHAPYAIVKGYKSDSSKRIFYRQVLPYEAWMKDACLDIREDLCGCGNPARSLTVSQLVNQVRLEQIIGPYTVTPFLSYIQPQAEAVKRREMKWEANLDFVVNKIDIRPDYMHNARELASITDMLETVRADSAVTVQGITVTGYASPEGTAAGNQRLSEGRAEALVSYLLPRFNYPRSLYSVAYGGENWNGLIDKVEASDMKYRDEVMNILKNIPVEINYKTNTSRKKSLMTLRGGAPYLYMLHEFYPSLRKAVCKVDYVVKGFELAEAKKIFGTRPQNLSLNEMYLIANSYEAGTVEFAGVFETAAMMFPGDETANLNAAAAALSRRDTVAAERYLAKVTTPSAEYDNTKGVLLLLKEEYAEAGKYLELAANAGLEAAKSNLAELQKKQENIRIINEQTIAN